MRFSWAAVLVAGACGSGGSDGDGPPAAPIDAPPSIDAPPAPVDAPPTIVDASLGVFDYYVAPTGMDNNAGTSGAPFRSITHAVAVAGPGKSIGVSPGAYDITTGETFPIVLAAGQSIVGDVANKGMGPTLTLVQGTGPSGQGDAYTTAMVGAAGARISGLCFEDLIYTPSFMAVHVKDVTMEVSDNTFGASVYGGVYVTGTGTTVARDNVFQSLSYGVYVDGAPGSPLVQGNAFVSPSIAVNILGPTQVVVRANTFTAAGLVGIQAQSGAAFIDHNVFVRTAGYDTYGAVRVSGGTPRLRGNVFSCAKAVRVDFGGTPDVGTSGEAGNNNFVAVTGAAVDHQGTAAVIAIGNTFQHAPPTCGTDILTTGGGSVAWGAGAGDHCPP